MLDAYTEPHWTTSALITIDMQDDFVSGAFAVPGTNDILPKLRCLTDTFRQAKLPIFHAIRLYSVDGCDAELCRKTAIQGGKRIAAPRTKGAELAEGVLPLECNLDIPRLQAGMVQQVGPKEYIFYKSRWSAFFSTRLETWLQEHGADTVIVAGCNFPNCPSATIFDATSRDFRVVLAMDATSVLDAGGLMRATGLGVNCLPVGDIQQSIREQWEAECDRSVVGFQR